MDDSGEAVFACAWNEWVNFWRAYDDQEVVSLDGEFEENSLGEPVADWVPRSFPFDLARKWLPVFMEEIDSKALHEFAIDAKTPSRETPAHA